MPIKAIRNGIIETKDGRYIKIMEVRPINFMLLSHSEQSSIIYYFGSWLKISPMKIQLKSFTRKADSNNYVRSLLKDMEQESNPELRQHGQDYIRFIQALGNQEALSRWFFLIFQYEPQMSPNRRKETYAGIVNMLSSTEQAANVDLTNKYIVLDLSEMTGKLLPVGMFLALDYVWDQVKANRTEKKAIFLDEIWQLIGSSSNRMAAEFCLEIFKIIRGYGGAALAATQDLHDFFTLDEGRFGRAIVNVSKNRIILNLEPDEAEYVQDLMKLTNSEIKSITRFERGQALVCSGGAKIPISIKASAMEAEMITTDREELKQLLEKSKKKSQAERGGETGGNQ